MFSLLASFRFSKFLKIVVKAVLYIINIVLMQLLTNFSFVLEVNTDK